MTTDGLKMLRQIGRRQGAREEKFNFSVNARRNKKMGIWAAEKMDLPEILIEEYWKEVVRCDLLGTGPKSVFEKIRKDFDETGVDQSDHQIERTMNEFLEEAYTEIKEGL